MSIFAKESTKRNAMTRTTELEMAKEALENYAYERIGESQQQSLS